jgi:hypothetical protein
MSIAVSAIVQPSRLLFGATLLMSLTTLVLGIAIGLRIIGQLPPTYSWLTGLTMIFAAVFGFYHGAHNRKILHIDISGEGRIRLSKVEPARGCKAINWPHVKVSGETVNILKDSTIWPYLLLLRLQAESGKITIVPIMPDSVSRDSFRALFVACRWAATHNDQREIENFYDLHSAN